MRGANPEPSSANLEWKPHIYARVADAALVWLLPQLPADDVTVERTVAE